MSRQQILREKIRNPQTFTTSLLTIALDRFGTELLEWHPTTIGMEIADEFQVPLPPLNRDKLMCGIGLLTSDDFYRRLPIFVQYCNVLSGSRFMPGIVDPADVDECAWGLTEALIISPPDPQDDEPFDDEIRYYIGGVLNDEGIKSPPDILRLGLWDEQPAFSDSMLSDPEMFQMQFEVQASEAAQIEQMLKTRLKQLIEELQSLPLQNGDSSNILAKMRQSK